MEIPKELRYSREHEWVAIDDGIATIGITDFAQEQLGDIVYVELPETGTQVTKDDKFGVVESVKAVSDVYSPVTGTVVAVNTGLPTSPETLNEEPYGDGWMIRVEMSDAEELNDLMTAAEYEKFIEEAEEAEEH
jgi:glycine cleavage system H protein